jgi:hypothetical protein
MSRKNCNDYLHATCGSGLELDNGIQKLEKANITRKLVENGAGRSHNFPFFVPGGQCYGTYIQWYCSCFKARIRSWLHKVEK